MLHRAFLYYPLTKEWKETEDIKLIECGGKELPINLFVKTKWYHNSEDHFTCFCDKCKRLQVSTPVYNNDNNDTLKGFYMDCGHYKKIAWGQMASFERDDYDREYNEIKPYRWRIYYNEDSGLINTSCDYININVTNPLKFSIKQWNLNIDFAGKRARWNGSEKSCDDSPKSIGFDMPDIVSRAALTLLQQETQRQYGIYPDVKNQLSGQRLLLAQLYRPKDLGIFFLKDLFEKYHLTAESKEAEKNQKSKYKYDGNVELDTLYSPETGAIAHFDSLFPPDCKDNYKLVFDYLNIDPPQALKSVYEENPYSVMWYCILRHLGLRDIKYISQLWAYSKFNPMLLLEQFGFEEEYIYPFTWFRNGNNKLQKTRIMFINDRWKSVLIFCHMILTFYGEEKLCRILKYLLFESSFLFTKFTICDYIKYWVVFPDSLIAKLFEEGFTPYVNICMSKITEYYFNDRNIAQILFKNEMIYSTEGIINGYEFHLETRNDGSKASFTSSGRNKLYNSDYYGENIAYYRIKKDGKNIAYMVYKPERGIVMAKTVDGMELCNNMKQICRFWCEHNGIEPGPFLEIFGSNEKLTFSYEERFWAKELEKADITDYINRTNRFYEKLNDFISKNADKIKPPSNMVFASPKDLVECIIPCGEKLFEDAEMNLRQALCLLLKIYNQGMISDESEESKFRLKQLNDKESVVEFIDSHGENKETGYITQADIDRLLSGGPSPFEEEDDDKKGVGRDKELPPNNVNTGGSFTAVVLNQGTSTIEQYQELVYNDNDVLDLKKKYACTE